VLQGEESLKAVSWFFQGVCLIVDKSGFTALSEGFCDAGKLGIDGLQVCTNGYIGDLVAIVQSHGGDIVKFAGDALICVFADDKLTPTTRSRKREDVDIDVSYCYGQ
jgi:class 3 adenylate cyclase